MRSLRLSNVTLRYANRTIFSSFTLNVEEGERLVILGPSGSGKTTLLRLIAGFVAPTKGTIYIGEKPVSETGHILVPPEKRGIGMVFQDLALWPHMNVEKNIGFGLKVRRVGAKERSRRVDAMLELVGLPGCQKKRISQLSGGERQRVALARALVLEPDTLLMDEPLSSLDETLQRRLAHEIVRLQERLQFTLFYVTHHHEEAAIIGTRRLTIQTPPASI